MVQARQDAGLSQAQVAKRMGTKPPAIARLESSLSSGKHSPSLATLRKYAEAVGCHLEIRLVRAHPEPDQIAPEHRTALKIGAGTGLDAPQVGLETDDEDIA